MSSATLTQVCDRVGLPMARLLFSFGAASRFCVCGRVCKACHHIRLSRPRRREPEGSSKWYSTGCAQRNHVCHSLRRLVVAKRFHVGFESGRDAFASPHCIIVPWLEGCADTRHPATPQTEWEKTCLSSSSNENHRSRAEGTSIA